VFDLIATIHSPPLPLLAVFTTTTTTSTTLVIIVIIIIIIIIAAAASVLGSFCNYTTQTSPKGRVPFQREAGVMRSMVK